MTNISMIAALAADGGIGNKNELLFHLPEDLRRFKAITSGHAVIMGRKTFESLPAGPLPKRRNIVISTIKDLKIKGCEIFKSVEEAIEATKAEEEVFVIGGGQIYSQFMEHASRLYLTCVDKTFPADTFFPAMEEGAWALASREDNECEKNGFKYYYLDFVRNEEE